MFDVAQIANQADVIVGGFAVVFGETNHKVMNLNDGNSVAIFTRGQVLIETNMDDIQLSIAQKTLAEALSYEAA